MAKYVKFVERVDTKREHIWRILADFLIAGNLQILQKIGFPNEGIHRFQFCDTFNLELTVG
jgi:hypothetical protein